MVLLAACERFWVCAATQWSPQTPWRALQPSRHAGGRPRSPRLRSPKTKQRHRRASHAVRTGSKSGEGGAQKNFRGRGQGAVKRKSAWMKSCPVLLTTRGRQQNRTPAAASPVRSDGKSARFSARSWCAARCAHGKAARSAPLRRRRDCTTRDTGFKHARTRLRLTPALGAP